MANQKREKGRKKNCKRVGERHHQSDDESMDDVLFIMTSEMNSLGYVYISFSCV